MIPRAIRIGVERSKVVSPDQMEVLEILGKSDQSGHRTPIRMSKTTGFPGRNALSRKRGGGRGGSKMHNSREKPGPKWSNGVYFEPIFRLIASTLSAFELVLIDPCSKVVKNDHFPPQRGARAYEISRTTPWSGENRCRRSGTGACTAPASRRSARAGRGPTSPTPRRGCTAPHADRAGRCRASPRTRCSPHRVAGRTPPGIAAGPARRPRPALRRTGRSTAASSSQHGARLYAVTGCGTRCATASIARVTWYSVSFSPVRLAKRWPLLRNSTSGVRSWKPVRAPGRRCGSGTGRRPSSAGCSSSALDAVRGRRARSAAG